MLRLRDKLPEVAKIKSIFGEKVFFLGVSTILSIAMHGDKKCAPTKLRYTGSSDS